MLDTIAEVTVVWPPVPGGRLDAPKGKGEKGEGDKGGGDKDGNDGKGKSDRRPARYPDSAALVTYRTRKQGPFHRENSTSTRPDPPLGA